MLPPQFIMVNIFHLLSYAHRSSSGSALQEKRDKDGGAVYQTYHIFKVFRRLRVSPVFKFPLKFLDLHVVKRTGQCLPNYRAPQDKKRGPQLEWSTFCSRNDSWLCFSLSLYSSSFTCLRKGTTFIASAERMVIRDEKRAGRKFIPLARYLL